MAVLQEFVDGLLQSAGWDAPNWADLLIGAVLSSVLLFTLVLTIGGLFTFAFRRIFARMGRRIGPNRVGPMGILQFVADGMKLITKEDVRPAKVDRLAWGGAVYIAVAFTVAAWAAIPWSRDAIFANVWIGVLLIFAMSAIAPLAEIMAGWGSNNKYSLYGGVRAAALDVSYEIPLVFTVASIFVMVGSASTVDIVDHEFGLVALIPLSIGFVIFMITGLAKAGLVPTDLAESESELVAGFTTEYSGMRFGMFFVVIFSNVMFISALVTLFYLDGYNAPFGNLIPGLNTIFGSWLTPVFWFLTKALVMCFVVFWLWSTLPRVRVDRYMRMAWKVLLPLSLFNLILTMALVRLEVIA